MSNAQESKPKKRPRAHDFLMHELDKGKLRQEGWTAQHNLVLRDVCERINHKTKDAWPSIASIARRTWISERQVTKLVGDLKRAGILHVEERSHRSHIYGVVLKDAVLNGFEYMPLYGPDSVTSAEDFEKTVDEDGSDWGATTYEEDAAAINGWNGLEPQVNEWNGSEVDTTPLSERPHPVQRAPHPALSLGYPVLSAPPPRSESAQTSQVTSQPTSQRNRELEPLPVWVPVQVHGFSTPWRQDNINSNDNDKSNSKNNTTASSELSLPVQLSPTATTPRDAATPSSEELEELTAGVAELFPTAKLYKQDLIDLLVEQGLSAGKIVQILRWVKEESTGDWDYRLAKADSAFLRKNFQRMRDLRERWLAGIRKNRGD